MFSSRSFGVVTFQIACPFEELEGAVRDLDRLTQDHPLIVNKQQVDENTHVITDSMTFLGLSFTYQYKTIRLDKNELKSDPVLTWVKETLARDAPLRHTVIAAKIDGMSMVWLDAWQTFLLEETVDGCRISSMMDASTPLGLASYTITNFKAAHEKMLLYIKRNLEFPKKEEKAVERKPER